VLGKEMGRRSKTLDENEKWETNGLEIRRGKKQKQVRK